MSISSITYTKGKRHSHAATALRGTFQVTKYIFGNYSSSLKYLFFTVNANHDNECLCKSNLEADAQRTRLSIKGTINTV